MFLNIQSVWVWENYDLLTHLYCIYVICIVYHTLLKRRRPICAIVSMYLYTAFYVVGSVAMLGAYRFCLRQIKMSTKTGSQMVIVVESNV